MFDSPVFRQILRKRKERASEKEIREIHRYSVREKEGERRKERKKRDT